MFPTAIRKKQSIEFSLKRMKCDHYLYYFRGLYGKINLGDGKKALKNAQQY